MHQGLFSHHCLACLYFSLSPSASIRSLLQQQRGGCDPDMRPQSELSCRGREHLAAAIPTDTEGLWVRLYALGAPESALFGVAKPPSPPGPGALAPCDRPHCGLEIVTSCPATSPNGWGSWGESLCHCYRDTAVAMTLLCKVATHTPGIHSGSKRMWVVAGVRSSHP